jgi:hypothetical protein
MKLLTSAIFGFAVFIGASPVSAQNASRSCQTGQAIVADDFDAPVSMTIRSGAFCNRQITTTRFRLDDLQFLTLPRNGKLAKNGKFGYRYTANKGYVGPDNFHIRYVGQKVSRNGSPGVNVYQGIKWAVNVIP